MTGPAVPGEPPLAAHLARQAEACERMGSPLYARLLRACLDDLRADGPVADVLSDHLRAPGPAATGLRLLGGVHHLVLSGAAPRLAAQYPSVGGRPADDLVPAFLATVADSAETLRRFVTGPPQTNEVGRAAALVGGLLRVQASLGSVRPVRLHEIGSSAGLNLNADRYRYRCGTSAGWWGPSSSPVALTDAWQGSVPSGDLEIVERLGSDVAPVDLTVPGAAERLLAYVWADQVDRVQRMGAALAVATVHPVTVDRLDAVAALDRLALHPGHLTVLWHSVMWQYLGADDQAAVRERLDRLGATADVDAPLVHLSLEPRRPGPGQAHEFLVEATVWPGGERTLLGRSVGHGVPTTWLL